MSAQSDVHRQLGITIRQLREKKGLSQAELADEAGMHPAFLGGIERAERNPSLSTLVKVAEALEVDLAKLFRSQKKR